MPNAKIVYYVDSISPFGYLSYWLLRNSPAFENVDIEYVPVVLGGLHKLCNNTAPIFVKNKYAWINKERLRWASYYSIPIRASPPRTFPVSTVNPMRALTALQMEIGGTAEGDEKVARVLDVFWAMIWNPDAVEGAQNLRDEGGKGEFDMKDLAGLTSVMAEIVGGDVAERVVKRIGEKDVKDKLGANTQRAFEAGAFGLPWLECVNPQEERDDFWGTDHLWMACKFLGVDSEKLEMAKGQKVKASL